MGRGMTGVGDYFIEQENNNERARRDTLPLESGRRERKKCGATLRSFTLQIVRLQLVL